jgi:hypothetical protein
MLSNRPTDSYPGFIKWSIREIAITLLFYSEYLDPRDLPAGQVASELQMAIKALRKVLPLFKLCPEGGTKIDWIAKPSAESELNDVFEGVKVSYWSHDYQKGLDEILGRYWPKPS